MNSRFTVLHKFYTSTCPRLRRFLRLDLRDFRLEALVRARAWRTWCRVASYRFRAWGNGDTNLASSPRIFYRYLPNKRHVTAMYPPCNRHVTVM